MELGTDKRAWWRNVDFGRDIYPDITLFAASWTGSCIRQNVEDRTGQMDFKIIHINYERNTADALHLWWCISDLIICLECEFPQDIV